MSAIGIFGAGAAMLALGGLGVTVEATRHILASLRAGMSVADWPVLAAMIFIFMVDVLVAGVGTLIAILDASGMGGAHG